VCFCQLLYGSLAAGVDSERSDIDISIVAPVIDDKIGFSRRILSNVRDARYDVRVFELMPLYLKVFAGLGYILGMLGLFLWYKSFKQARKSKDESDIDPAHQVRFGMEYLLVNPKSNYVIPLRAGVFYDPSPAQASPDDYYGFSLGSGFSMDKWVFDIAYQYKFGNDVGASFTQGPSVSQDQDVEEHMVYSSLIIHF